MTKYVQTNQQGYVTGVVEEELLVGLFGGASTSLRIPDDRAGDIEKLLKAYHSKGEGLHINEVRRLEGQRN